MLAGVVSNACVCLLFAQYAHAAPTQRGGDTVVLGAASPTNSNGSPEYGGVKSKGGGRVTGKDAKWTSPGARYSYTSMTTLLAARDSSMIVDAVVRAPKLTI